MTRHIWRPHLFVDAPLAGAAVAVAMTWGLPATLPLAGLAAALHTWGVVSPRSSWYTPLTWQLPAGSADLALTFDDGPDPDTTPRILDLLAAHDLHATFFCIGRNVERWPDLVRQIRAAGHGLGLHTHSNARAFTWWTPRRLVADLKANAAALAAATGEAPPRLWRPPVGLKNPFLVEAARRLGLSMVTWSHRGFDTGSASAERVTSRLMAGIRPRAILVLHDGSEPEHPRDTTVCAEVLAALAPAIRRAGLSSVVLHAATARGVLAAGSADPSH